MKFTKTLITSASAVFLLSSSFLVTNTFASENDNDNTNIIINVTKNDFVNFTGTVDTAATAGLSIAEVTNSTTSIGTLGVASNVTGDCDVDFSSENGYKLLNGGVALHGENTYLLSWNSSSIDAANPTVTLSGTSCNLANTALSVVTTGLTPANTIAAGTYSDTIAMTVTTQ